MIGWIIWNVVPGLLLSAILSLLVITSTEPPQPPPREWHDIFLIAILIVFYLMKGTLIERKSGLGWALTAANIALALLFGWGLFAPLWSPLLGMTIIGSALRVLLAICVLLSIVELAAARFGWPSPLEIGWRRRRGGTQG